jgi:hypothetical protein
MYFDEKLEHAFIVNNDSIVEIIFAQYKCENSWSDIKEILTEDECFDFLVDLVKNDDLPILHFKTALGEPTLREESLTLQIGFDFIPCEV